MAWQMGDPLTRRAEEVLRQGWPYPGDIPGEPRFRNPEHFYVHWISPVHHIIVDSARGVNQDWDTIIGTENLSNLEFHLGDWYARRLVNQGYGTEDERLLHYRYHPMAATLAQRVNELLMVEFDLDQAITGLLPQFTCLMADNGIVIWDRIAALQLCLPMHLALNERLDVVNWYRRTLQ